MDRRYVSIWFPYLETDYFALKDPRLHSVPFVLKKSSRGRIIITSVNRLAEEKGIFEGMALADARAAFPDLHADDHDPVALQTLLNRIAEWSIRFSPVVSVDPHQGLIIESTGCSHLWGGEAAYLDNIMKRISKKGFSVKGATAGTIGVAWALSRFSTNNLIIGKGDEALALRDLPPEALRIEPEIAERLHKLGLGTIGQFIHFPQGSLRRRFGDTLVLRIGQALGNYEEHIVPVFQPEPYEERLPCLEPILTAEGIEIALAELLVKICNSLGREYKGLRQAIFKGFRIDGKVEVISVRTTRPSINPKHLFKLLALKIPKFEPGPGIELFLLTAEGIEECYPKQEKMWETPAGLSDPKLSELIDRLTNKVAIESIHRYLPDEHYWPERSVKKTHSLDEKPLSIWTSNGNTRPSQLLSTPEKIEVTAPIPDYPPMLFRYRGKVHQVKKADGPERIEQEWWLQQGQHRDYYRVEDELGKRYWIFRLGHYDDKNLQWFLHGFFP